MLSNIILRSLWEWPWMIGRVRRKPTYVSLDENLLAEAKALGINLSRAAEAGVRQAVAGRNADRWKAENRSAIESADSWTDTNGLPLDPFRRF